MSSLQTKTRMCMAEEGSCGCNLGSSQCLWPQRSEETNRRCSSLNRDNRSLESYKCLWVLRYDRLFLDGAGVISFVWMLRCTLMIQAGVLEVQEKVRVELEERIRVMWKRELCTKSPVSQTRVPSSLVLFISAVLPMLLILPCGHIDLTASFLDYITIEDSPSRV